MPDDHSFNHAQLREDGIRLTGMLERHPDHSRLLTSVSFGVLRSKLVRCSPMEVEQAEKYSRSQRKSRIVLPQDLEDLQRLRGAIQRGFKGNRKSNVLKFATYFLRRALAGKAFSTPPIALYTPDQVLCDRFESDNGVVRSRPVLESDHGVIGTVAAFIEPTARIMAIDGETQLAALFQAREQLSLENMELEKKAIDRLPVGIELNFDADVTWAHHAFNVRNREGIKQTGLSLGAAESDPHIWVLQSLLDAHPHLKPFVDVKARSSTKAKPLTGSSLIQFIACFQVGTTGVDKAKASKDITDSELERLREQTIEWMEVLVQDLGPKLTDATYICSASHILAALGVLGHAVLRSSGQRRDLQKVRSRLRAINWLKGPHWIGIAGKAGADGLLCVGGAKEYLALCYPAIASDEGVGSDRILMAVAVS
jgi:hypothetical protein